jgi:hypothetical protein
MKLNPTDILLGEIMIDPYNPRFTEEGKITNQDTLKSELLKSGASKELLNSMKADIKWVNRIVVQKVETHQESTNLNKIKGNFKYIAVEGNTRLACLKSGSIEDFNENTPIPVLLAEKEINESIEDFKKQIRITQGIANVTVVKEWSQVAKAKHLSSLFNDSISGNKAQDVYKQISTELGLSIREVRELIIRYKIFFKIAEISDPIDDDNWGFLEAFDKNVTIRKLIGLNENNDFVTQDDEYYDEIISQIPNLIKHALNQGIHTKPFRDIILDISRNHKTSEDFNTIIREILDSESNISLVSLKNNIQNKSDKEQWEDDLKNILVKISTFPNASDWARDLKDNLMSIQEKINKHISVIDS